MKVKKQIALMIAMLLLPLAASADAVEINGICYNLNADTKQAEVTKNPNNYSGSVDIPSSVSAYNVTSIGDYAFQSCYNLTSVTIPNSVTSIGVRAFDDTGLTSIIIPNSVTSIGISAFNECISLTSVTIGNSVTSIESGAFLFCFKLSSITIPNSVTTIGNSAFYQCSRLTSVTIGNSVTSIGVKAFYYCTRLTKVRSKIMKPFSIDANVFEGLPASATLYVPKGTKKAYEATGGWNVFSKIEEYEEKPGDLNDDGEVDVTDVVELIDNVLSGTFKPVLDINGDGEVDVTDVVELIDMVLAGE